MKLSFAAIASLLAFASHAQPAAPTAPFEVAYRAWDLVTELAKAHNDPSISGECGRTFRPFVIPGLRMQNRQEQDVAAVACVNAARAACKGGRLRMPAETARKCEEFR